MSKLRILSNNQWRCDANTSAWNEQGLDCSAEARESGFARMFYEIDADIIGLQECSPLMAELHMHSFMKNGLDYALLWGRDTPVLYKPKKFDLIDSAYLNYPKEIPGFDGEFNNKNTKSYCIAVFRSKENGKTLIFGSTHLWYKSGDPSKPNYFPGSAEARSYQLGLMIDKIDEFILKYNCPAIIVGDLNAAIGSAALETAFSRGFCSSHDLATEYADSGNGFHYCTPEGYGPYVPSSYLNSIDHILIKGEEGLKVLRFDRLSKDYYMPLSDHLPLWVDIEL